MQPTAKAGKANRPAGDSAEPTGQSPRDTSAQAFRELLVNARTREQMSDAATTAQRLAKLKDVVRRFDSLPVLDNREPDDIIGYDESGLPT